MGFVKENITKGGVKWEDSNGSFSTLEINWEESWLKEKSVDPNAYTYYSTVWNSVSGKWNELT
jgi:hypothetical protein